MSVCLSVPKLDRGVGVDGVSVCPNNNVTLSVCPETRPGGSGDDWVALPCEDGGSELNVNGESCVGPQRL